MTKANPNNRHICAFCALWYDPANSHIYPSKPYNGEHWEYDEKASAPCFKKTIETKSDSSCSHFKPKKLL